MSSWHAHWLQDYARRMAGIATTEPYAQDPSDDTDARTRLLAELDSLRASIEVAWRLHRTIQNRLMDRTAALEAEVARLQASMRRCLSLINVRTSPVMESIRGEIQEALGD